MKIIDTFRYLVLVVLCVLAGACTKEENLDSDIVGLGGEKWVKNEIDHYVYDNFTKPYNIDVLYRWNASEVSFATNLVPPYEDKVIPVMEMVKKGWIDPYVEIAGEDFIKKFAPRQYLLVGSPEYNTSGTITLGTAEAGAKIVLYRVNWFDLKDRELVQAMLKTIHHEFAHILHQNVMYPLEFESITTADYTSTWNQVNVTDARRAGFISSYAMSAPSEDFVEIAAIMLTQGYGPFENIISSIDNTEGVRKIREKQEIVVNYFRQTWNINLYELQEKTEAAINLLSPPPAAFDRFGFDKVSNVLFTTHPADEANWSPLFKEAFQTASASLGTYQSNAGRYLEDVNVAFMEQGKMTLRLKYRNPSSPASFYNADFSFDYVEDQTAETIRFDYVGTLNGNGTTTYPYLIAMLNYFDQQTFRYSWSNDGAYPTNHLKMVRTDNPASYMYGLLKNGY